MTVAVAGVLLGGVLGSASAQAKARAVRHHPAVHHAFGREMYHGHKVG